MCVSRCPLLARHTAEERGRSGAGAGLCVQLWHGRALSSGFCRCLLPPFIPAVQPASVLLSMPSALERLMFFQNVVLCKAATHLSSTGKHLTLCLKRNFQPPYSSSLWSKGHNASCKLTARDSMQNRYHCTIHLASQILETDGYRVSLQGNFFGRNHMYIIFPEYNPCKHSKYEQGSCGLRLCPAAQGRPDMLSRKGISKTTSENNGNKAECPPWRAHCVGCISKNAGPVSLHSDLSRTSERAGALEHLSSTLLICIMFSCAMDNIQLDCLYGCFLS